MQQLTWITVVISFCSAQMTVKPFAFSYKICLYVCFNLTFDFQMASSNLNSNSTEFKATPILFRSAFNDRPRLASRQENVAANTEKPSTKIHQIEMVEEKVEEIPEKTNGSEENDEENGNESRYKKNATQEKDSDESDSDESDSDENDVLINGVEKVDERPTKPSRWHPTRFGSSFRLQAVRRPIDYRHPN